jgi:hypothetical protein
MRGIAALAAALVLAGANLDRIAHARTPCGTVEIVCANGRPAVEAEVSHYRLDPRTGAHLDRKAWNTGRDGRVCDERLLEPGFLEVHAPLAFGGWCAGMEELSYQGRLSANTRDPGQGRQYSRRAGAARGHRVWHVAPSLVV